MGYKDTSTRDFSELDDAAAVIINSLSGGLTEQDAFSVVRHEDEREGAKRSFGSAMVRWFLALRCAYTTMIAPELIHAPSPNGPVVFAGSLP